MLCPYEARGRAGPSRALSRVLPVSSIWTLVHLGPWQGREAGRRQRGRPGDPGTLERPAGGAQGRGCGRWHTPHSCSNCSRRLLHLGQGKAAPGVWPPGPAALPRRAGVCSELLLWHRMIRVAGRFAIMCEHACLPQLGTNDTATYKAPQLVMEAFFKEHGPVVGCAAGTFHTCVFTGALGCSTVPVDLAVPYRGRTTT